MHGAMPEGRNRRDAIRVIIGRKIGSAQKATNRSIRLISGQSLGQSLNRHGKVTSAKGGEANIFLESGNGGVPLPCFLIVTESLTILTTYCFRRCQIVETQSKNGAETSFFRLDCF